MHSRRKDDGFLFPSRPGKQPYSPFELADALGEAQLAGDWKAKLLRRLDIIGRPSW